MDDPLILACTDVSDWDVLGFVVYVLLDYSKTLDVVCGSVLLPKLRDIGDNQTWINSFLVGHTMKVVVDGICGESRYVWSGVPQGFVIGWVLFLVL